MSWKGSKDECGVKDTPSRWRAYHSEDEVYDTDITSTQERLSINSPNVRRLSDAEAQPKEVGDRPDGKVAYSSSNSYPSSSYNQRLLHASGRLLTFISICLSMMTTLTSLLMFLRHFVFTA